MPNQVPSGLYSGNNSGFRPLFGFGQDNYNVQLGRGLIGQPVAYVVGQPFEISYAMYSRKSRERNQLEQDALVL